MTAATEPARKNQNAAGAKVSRQEIRDVVESVASTLHGDLTPADLKIYQELAGIVRYIQTAKSEIAALCPDEIREKHIREATDELDAIVAHTEDATGAILDAAEKIEAIAGSLDVDPAMKLAEAVTKIYEACNFQDITGQRIGKVVTALKNIEAKIESLTATLMGGAPLPAAPAPAAEEAPANTDADLLRGPQLPGNAKNQDEIDALLKSFD
jgi:chemotaxis protein CheZ